MTALHEHVDPDAGLDELDLRTALDMIENLRRALDSSRLIGTAIGIIVERYKVSTDVAFGVLAEASQESNRKLRDIAGDVVFSGELPSVVRPT